MRLTTNTRLELAQVPKKHKANAAAFVLYVLAKFHKTITLGHARQVLNGKRRLLVKTAKQVSKTTFMTARSIFAQWYAREIERTTGKVVRPRNKQQFETITIRRKVEKLVPRFGEEKIVERLFMVPSFPLVPQYGDNELGKQESKATRVLVPCQVKVLERELEHEVVIDYVEEKQTREVGKENQENIEEKQGEPARVYGRTFQRIASLFTQDSISQAKSKFFQSQEKRIRPSYRHYTNRFDAFTVASRLAEMVDENLLSGKLKTLDDCVSFGLHQYVNAFKQVYEMEKPKDALTMFSGEATEDEMEIDENFGTGFSILSFTNGLRDGEPQGYASSQFEVTRQDAPFMHTRCKCESNGKKIAHKKDNPKCPSNFLTSEGNGISLTSKGEWRKGNTIVETISKGCTLATRG